MTTSLILYQYYYRYKQFRKNIKTLVDSLDYTEAQTELETRIAEQQNFYGLSLSNSEFNALENSEMIHANTHLDAVIDQNDPPYIDTDTQQTKHQSDIVKDSLTVV